ncbi:Eco57I restriction-modification methylase domain-containing protein [Natronorubrum daqingense]|uniref:site-specific DNA-methyltransferase (adenine-specific) n=1 Tax=Natronorubrum daqingense TaxID=588898 RepID=A0A1N7FHE8_9EURY|nr:N-6 DNA methylase [Natronorubrum daqingense]APX98447.1 restriction endonuclease [Natronorubrum daqingense]SIR99720.1 N-6 DNA Methylase [Natronorubrum daqingense]
MQPTRPYRTNRDLFSNHYLDEQLPKTDAWRDVDDGELRAAFDAVSELWEREQETAPKRNESQLEETFIRPIFRMLGIPFEVEATTDRTRRRPDYAFFDAAETARDAYDRRGEGGEFYANALAVADAKRWGRPLDTRGSGEHRRDFENPSYQIHVYLQETPAEWAVLTDGKRWRLYYGPTSHRLDSYYEIDLPALLEGGDLSDFKYFYLFFRHEAFLADGRGERFLDDVYAESSVFAQELGADLQANIYEAITVLAEGYLEYPENDLGEADLELVHDSSLIYLYRLIFVLYAESDGRDLLDTSNEIYERSYSLHSLKQTVADELDGPTNAYHGWQNTLESRVADLFALIDQGSESLGIPPEKLSVPAYNGGLFRTDPDETDSPEARFLATHSIGDEHLATVIDLLTRSEAIEGDGKTFVDYSSLDVRHLGSIYEGLLEYQLSIADEPMALEDGEYVVVEEGEAGDDIAVADGDVYLSTDSGKRKATGSYYTPEPVVEYIVEETLEPLVAEIRQDLVGQSAHGTDRGFADEFAEQVFELNVLDPAMGSGHFLTNAVDYLAREIVDAQERQAAQDGLESVDDDHDINWARRQVAQRCIYGVDLNPLAVELAKVSLWLRTLAAEQPLAFLDHHLKAGNSLVGSDIESIEGLESAGASGGQNATLADFGIARKGTIEQLLHIYQDFIAIENRDLADVKQMEAKYDEFERNKLRRRLEAMAHVQTAADVGLSVPDGAYERMAWSLEDDSRWADLEQTEWFRTAREWAARDRYFHWRLEYPEVFYTDSGAERESGGFDAVIGNPPWVRSITLKRADADLWNYYGTQYEAASSGEFDSYLCFIEHGLELLADDGEFGYIVPNKWLTSQAGESLRSYLGERGDLERLVDFGPHQLFDGITTYSCVLLANGDETQDVDIWQLVEPASEGETPLPDDDSEWRNGTVDRETLGESPWSFDIGPLGELFDRLSENPTLGDIASVFKGIGTNADPVYLLERTEGGYYSSELERVVELEDELLEPALKGSDIDRYTFDRDRVLLFPYETTDAGVELYSKETLETEFPKTWSYLTEVRETLEDRESGRYRDTPEWYQFGRPQNMRRAREAKVVVPDVVDEGTAAVDADGRAILDTVYGIQSEAYDKRFLTALLNSDLLSAFLTHTGTDLRGGYVRMKTAYLDPFPVPSLEFDGAIDSLSADRLTDLEAYATGEIETLTIERTRPRELYETVCSAVDRRQQYTARLDELNLRLRDYLGRYDDGNALEELPEYQPPAGVADSILSETTATRDGLRLGSVDVEAGGSTLTVRASARYKPDDDAAFDTDRWGYAETALEPAITFVDLDDATRVLVREFVPVALEEADGFANVRETATKTNSLIDRLNALTLPAVGDVETGLEQFRQTKSAAETLEFQIERVDQVIEESLYDLYGLTDEEVAALEQVIGE